MFMPWGMPFATPKYQVVYRVTVYDASLERTRWAWMRLGTCWGSIDGDAV
jgi:hypothetical protein